MAFDSPSSARRVRGEGGLRFDINSTCCWCQQWGFFRLWPKTATPSGQKRRAGIFPRFDIKLVMSAVSHIGCGLKTAVSSGTSSEEDTVRPSNISLNNIYFLNVPSHHFDCDFSLCGAERFFCGIIPVKSRCNPFVLLFLALFCSLSFNTHSTISQLLLRVKWARLFLVNPIVFQVKHKVAEVSFLRIPGQLPFRRAA